MNSLITDDRNNEDFGEKGEIGEIIGINVNHEDTKQKKMKRSKSKRNLCEEFESMDIPQVNASFAASSSYSSSYSSSTSSLCSWTCDDQSRENDYWENNKINNKIEENENENENENDCDDIYENGGRMKKDTVYELIENAIEIQKDLNDILCSHNALFSTENPFYLDLCKMPIKDIIHSEEMLHMNKISNQFWEFYDTMITSEEESDEKFDQTKKENKENNENKEKEQKKLGFIKDAKNFESLVFELERICLTLESFAQYHKCNDDDCLEKYLDHEVDYDVIFSIDEI